ncbi:hypothetical protein [Aquihabitans sp. McL0605]|uniref:hypothetical protein n=1 Tax=Aquihabitans sp. McL0605 TaxID=3415671 RepID=UPI003CF90ED5
MRKYLIALVAVSSLAVLSACGSSDSGGASATTTTTAVQKATTTTTTVPKVPVATWVKGFCTSYGTWRSSIKTAADAIPAATGAGDAAAAKTAASTFFKSASTSTEALISSIAASGVPDIPNGDKLVVGLMTQFTAIDNAAKSAKTEADGLATNDISTVSTSIDELTTRFQDAVNKLEASFKTYDTKYPLPALNAALTKYCTA